jgi:hypothetical protein
LKFPIGKNRKKNLKVGKVNCSQYGGRVTLLNSTISAIPIYWMSIYKLSVHVRTVIDKLRKYFSCSDGHTVKKKYCLVS